MGLLTFCINVTLDGCVDHLEGIAGHGPTLYECHVGTVRGYTIQGHWRYLEHDWVTKPGTFIDEPAGEAPPGAVAANKEKLVHINTYGDIPNFYVDYPFQCVDCGIAQVWTAEQQKWYYEEAKGHIWAVAKRCGTCRKNRKSGGKNASGRFGNG